jgi:hypothetical protein
LRTGTPGFDARTIIKPASSASLRHTDRRVDLSDIIDQGVIRDLLDHLVAANRSRAPFQDGQSVSGSHRHRETEQGRSRVSQCGYLALKSKPTRSPVALRYDRTEVMTEGSSSKPITKGRKYESTKKSRSGTLP